MTVWCQSLLANLQNVYCDNDDGQSLLANVQTVYCHTLKFETNFVRKRKPDNIKMFEK